MRDMTLDINRNLNENYSNALKLVEKRMKFENVLGYSQRNLHCGF